MTPKLYSPEFLYVMANPIDHTINSGFSSVISWHAVSQKLIPSDCFMYVMFLRGGV